MKKSVLVIELPEINDDCVLNIRKFLHQFINSFENQYCLRLEQYSEMLSYEQYPEMVAEYEDPDF